MRVKPRAWIAVAVIVIYALVMGAVWKLTRTNYETVGDTAGNAFTGIVVTVGVASLFIVLATTYLGWWQPALRETPTGPRWLLILPIVVFLTSVGTLMNKGFDGVETKFVLTIALGTLLVGFGEEMATRGLGVVALRGSLGEVGVWFVSSLLFGLLHAINVLFGQSLADTIKQMGFTFALGSVFYLIRRVTGTLLVCVLLHAFWDFSIFVSNAATGESGPFALLALLQYVAIAFGVFGLFKVLRKSGGGVQTRSAVA